MADNHHLRILKRGVDSWNAWRRRTGDAPDLTEAELGGADLGRADLVGLTAGWGGAGADRLRELLAADFSGLVSDEADRGAGTASAVRGAGTASAVRGAGTASAVRGAGTASAVLEEEVAKVVAALWPGPTARRAEERSPR